MSAPTSNLKLRANWHTLALISMIAAMWYAAEAQSNGAAYLLALFVAVVAAVSIMHARANLRGVRIRVRTQGTAKEDARARVRVDLTNSAAHSACGIEVSIVGTGKSVFLDRIASGETRHVELYAPPQRRAGAPLTIIARSVYPLGLFGVESTVQTTGARRVHPKPSGDLPLPSPLPLSPHAQLQAGGSGGTTATRGGDDFAGTREWQLGDSPRHIDWRAVARGRPLVVKSWSASANGAVLLDWDAISLPEHARAGQIARWIDLCIHESLPFRLQLPGISIPVGAGTAHAQACLDALSDFVATNADLNSQQGTAGGMRVKAARRAPMTDFETSSHLPIGPLLLLCTALILCFLPLADIVSLPAITIAALCMVWRGLLRLPVPHVIVRALIVIVGVLLTWMTHTTLRSMEAGIALLIVLSGAKLLESKSPREFQILTLIGWFLCLCGIVLDNSLPRMLWCMAAFALVAMCLVRFRHSVPGLRRPAWLTTVIFLQAIPLVAVLFVVFPRGLINLSSTFGSRIGESGISGDLDPGGITQMALRMERAFRVEFPDGRIPTNDRRYWRCLTLWDCYGLRWRQGDRDRLGHMLRSIDPIPGEDLPHTIILDPHGRRWLPALDLPVSGKFSGDLMQPEYDDTFTSTYRINSAQRYSVLSRLKPTPFVELPEHHRKIALRVPEGISPRLQALAASWKNGASGNQEIALRGLNHLRSEGFSYTLTPDDYSAPDGLEKFMFAGRNGFCEHFSASFATLMRLAGVPSRIVIGFLGGEYSASKGQMIVRQSDAHAWVEVWIEGLGWTRADPTAWLAPDRIGGDMRVFLASGGSTIAERDLSWWSRGIFNARVLWDRLNYAWQDRIVEFDEDLQSNWLAQLGWITSKWWHLLAISIAILGTGLLTIMLWLRRRARHPDPWAHAWHLLCQKLARAGYAQRHASEGPLAYIRRIASGDPELNQLVETYAAARYGAQRSSTREFQARIRRLRLSKPIVRQA